jgi:CheY-like chemotaxis protein/glycine cleavage system H lipoate-binding protein
VKVLVVDDEQVVLDGVTRHLGRDGYEVRTASSGAEALEVVRAEPVDVLVSDLMMPGMDGLELLDTLRGEGFAQPMIMITGYATMRTALQALRKGAFDYIAKPFTRAELLGVVARASRKAAIDQERAKRTPTGPLPPGIRGYGHCWVKSLDDGTARLGPDRSFVATVGDPEGLELPEPGDFLEQGSACLKLLAKDGKTHVLWTPVSGNVLDVNPSLASNPRLVVDDPYGEGWLVRIEAGAIDDELEGLAEED